ncbi:MAG: glycosyltransferase family 4 protein [Solirubrobacteraceae bacterium]
MDAVRPRLAVALTFPVFPPLGGGQVRVYNLYRGLAKQFDVELVSLLPAGQAMRRTTLAPGLRETCIPKSPEHQAEEDALEREAGTAVTDIAMAELYRLTPDYIAALREATRGAHAAVACHPYTFPAIRCATDVRLWYEAQDVEATLKAGLLMGSKTGNELLAAAKRVERACCDAAELIWTCSPEDHAEMMGLYGGDPARYLVVPNGADLEDVTYVSPEQRRTLQRRLRQTDRRTAIFMASFHPPNIDAARQLLTIAARVPEMDFLVLGSVGWAFAREPLADNVQFAGPVSARFKAAVLSVADVALNPVTTGSGTNLKMLDYLGSGIPVLSTRFGARGLPISADEHYFSAEPADMPTVLRHLTRLADRQIEPVVQAARTMVEARLSWTAIARDLLARLQSAQISGGAGRRPAFSADRRSGQVPAPPV